MAQPKSDRDVSAQAQRKRIWESWRSPDGTGRPPLAHEGAVSGIAMLSHSEGIQLVTAGADGKILSCDLGNMRSRHTVINQSAAITAVAASSVNGRRCIVYGDSQGRIGFVDPLTRERIDGTWTGHEGQVLSIETCQLDGNTVVVTAGSDDCIRVWDPLTRHLVTGLWVGGDGTFKVRVVSPAQPLEVVKFGEPTLDLRHRIFGPAGAPPTKAPTLFSSRGVIASVHHNVLSGTVILAGKVDGELWLWRPGPSAIPFYVDLNSTVTCLALSSVGGDPIVSVGTYMGLGYWRAGNIKATEYLRHRWRCNATSLAVVETTVSSLGYGRCLAVGTKGGDVFLLTYPGGWPMASFDTGLKGAISALATTSIDGWPILVAGCADGSVFAFDIVEKTYREVIVSSRENFTRRFRHLRVERLESTALTAARVGVSSGTIMSWARGDSLPKRLELVERLEQALMDKGATIDPGELVALWNGAKLSK